MTNKIDETVEIPNVTCHDSGTRREDGWYMAIYRYDDETVESPAKVKGNDILFFGNSIWNPLRSDRVTLLYRITPPASLAAMREAMEKARKAMAALVRWDDVTSDESYDISEEGEQEGLVAACFQIRDALDALNQLNSTTPPAPNDGGLAKLLREIEWRGDVYEMDGQRFEVCPLCEQDKDDGHSPDCSLARWIAKVEGR